MSTLFMLYHERVVNTQEGVGRTDQASCSGQRSWNASRALGLQGAGFPCWNSHRLFAQGISLYSFPSHLWACVPSPEQAGACFGWLGCFGSC